MSIREASLEEVGRQSCVSRKEKVCARSDPTQGRECHHTCPLLLRGVKGPFAEHHVSAAGGKELLSLSLLPPGKPPQKESVAVTAGETEA